MTDQQAAFRQAMVAQIHAALVLGRTVFAAPTAGRRLIAVSDRIKRTARVASVSISTPIETRSTSRQVRDRGPCDWRQTTQATTTMHGPAAGIRAAASSVTGRPPVRVRASVPSSRIASGAGPNATQTVAPVIVPATGRTGTVTVSLNPQPAARRAARHNPGAREHSQRHPGTYLRICRGRIAEVSAGTVSPASHTSLPP